MTASAPDSNAINAVLYALSTVAQTCAALAALVGALALYKLQSMRDAHVATGRFIQELVDAHLPFGRPASSHEKLRTARQAVEEGRLHPVLVEGFRVAIAEWDRFDRRYARAVTCLVIFEAWNLLAILASLVGFTCASWLASRWITFSIMLAIASSMTIVVTGGAVYLMARSDSSGAIRRLYRRLVRPWR